MGLVATQEGRIEGRVEGILRVGVFLCFVGHGAFGLLRKEAWLAYLAALGIGPEAGAALMPVIGSLDVLVGVAVLVRPVRPVLAWAAFWGVATALLRPLAGEPVWEVAERAGNYGPPLALLALLAARSGGGRVPAATVLRAATVLLLLGHGALALGAKPLLVGHLATLGLEAGAVRVQGALEVALALAVAVAPSPAMLLGVAGWKLGTELLFPMSGAPVWELVERGGSVAAPAALALLLARPAASAAAARSVAPAAVRTASMILLLLAAAAAPAAGQDRERSWADVVREVPRGAGLRALGEELRGGGLVLLCRHAITDHDASDRGSAREQQRNLDEAGRAQARRMGEAMRDAGIPVGEVRASPMFRTMDSAELAFGRVESDTVLRGARHADELAALLSSPTRGGNRVLMTHQGTIRRVVPIGRAPLEEGDCLLVRPLRARGFEVLARVGADDWRALAEAGDRERAH